MHHFTLLIVLIQTYSLLYHPVFSSLQRWDNPIPFAPCPGSEGLLFSEGESPPLLHVSYFQNEKSGADWLAVMI